MKKFFCLIGFLMTFQSLSADLLITRFSDFVFSDRLFLEPFEAGCCCARGLRGPVGPPGPPGPSGQAEINSFIEVTLNRPADVGGGLVPFTNPIVYPINGINFGGMSLIESVPASGNFDTITLPVESADTFYLVSFGCSLAIESSGEFQLVLNGTPLPYTVLGVEIDCEHIMKSRTNVIINPANTAGTLSLAAMGALAFIDPATENSFSAYMSVVKLNQNGG